ncbi:hypothetical protein D3C76_290760 [compost metagenome]
MAGVAEQETGLSHRTPREKLFKVYDEGTHDWVDLPDDIASGKAKVLSLTNTSTLSQARVAFLSDEIKRIGVMLQNADRWPC